MALTIVYVRLGRSGLILPKMSSIFAMKITRRSFIYCSSMAVLLLVSCLSLTHLSPYRSNSAEQYFRAQVASVTSSNSQSTGQEQSVHARLLDGPQKNQYIHFIRSTNFGDKAAKRLPIGSEVLLFKDNENGNQYNFIARWYMPGVATLFALLLVLVIIIGGWRGITSILGLSISILILASFIIPRIINGQNALITCIEGAVFITLSSVYIAHGFNKRTTVALAGALVTLAIIVGLTGFASYLTGTSEIIDDSNLGILYAPHAIDIGGLLTGGVVIGSLGALFDITTGQAATVDEIHKANHTQTTKRLFWKGMSVGREHIAALINTLALVYVGVALPTIVTVIVLNQELHYQVPLLVNLNTEALTEEIVRTSVASMGTLLALPITTLLAAYILPRWTPRVDAKIRQWFANL